LEKDELRMIRLVLAVCEVLVFVVEDIELEVDSQVVETLASKLIYMFV
jgi:hypothetical protein